MTPFFNSCFPYFSRHMILSTQLSYNSKLDGFVTVIVGVVVTSITEGVVAGFIKGVSTVILGYRHMF